MSTSNTKQLKAGEITKARPYNAEERKNAIKKYRSKRDKRNFSKRIKYHCRSEQANGQLRIRGRFARRDDVENVQINHRNHHHHHHQQQQQQQQVYISGDEGYSFSSESYAYSTENTESGGEEEWARQMQLWSMNLDTFYL
ncbi:CCT domain-containing protein [Dioscorea alata]|uniref:CCT domain-containing protein n=1 Tax=Dioscorea alata TaxID=55571 RepID=A0ACB7U966_DIOAL|nr:CCT domain-containing protein [Dioscorea alata]